MTALYVTGDVFDCLAATPTGSVDLIITSPPFLALRSYLPADHPDKVKEIGQEPTPAEFVDTLLALSAEFRRVLAPHGSIAVELGDTYAWAGMSGQRYDQWPGHGGYGGRGDDKAGDGWPEAKSACLIPELYRVALAYGLNPITGDPSPAGRWRVRNTIRWCRPNPPVGALGDKFRPATSDMVIACLDTPAGQRRYFDLDAVRGDPEDVKDQRTRTTNGPKRDADRSEVLTANYSQRVPSHPAGAPPLDWWKVSTEPYSGSHYATWPRKLLERPVKAMVPRRVCTVCGEPSRRIAETTNAVGHAVGRASWDGGTDGIGAGHSGEISVHANDSRVPDVAERRTIGWTDCGHNAWRLGIVLDPFGGSGTTLAVATGHGHHAIGFDLDDRNVDLARERVGPMFFEHLTLAEYRQKEAS